VVEGWPNALLVLLGGYLLGSVPFGLLVTRAGGAGDIRAIGSGNIGATNVLRTGRKGLAAATLLLDGGKGALAALAGELARAGAGPLAAVGAFYGHLFPVWLRFHGGKGVATFLGIALGLHWPIGLVALAAWLGGALVTRYSSMGAISAVVLTPVAASIFGRPDLTLVFLALALTVIWKHGDNIARLLDGTEPRVGQGKERQPG
jgi:acyl phosphate:glycerol-3-phosphate acyltransferase